MRFIASILVSPLILSYSLGLWSVLQNFSLVSAHELYFWLLFASSFIFNLLFVSGDSYISIFKHELTHNLFAILTFNKPTGFTVKRDEGGFFEYTGKGNFLITLSPYFFPTVSSFFILIYLLNPSTERMYFALLGFVAGFDLSSIIRDFHPSQTDLKENGYIFSLIFSMLGLAFFWGILISFVIGGWELTWLFIQSGLTFLFELL